MAVVATLAAGAAPASVVLTYLLPAPSPAATVPAGPPALPPGAAPPTDNAGVPPEPPEPWLTKREIARHYHFTVRWVEGMLAEGMPSRIIGNQRRFRLSEVDPWLRARWSDGNGR